MYEGLPPSLRSVLLRAQDELGQVDPSVQAILTGHLLVEELLTSLLEKLVTDQVSLQRADLRFFQRVQLVRALGPEDNAYSPSAWTLINKLNELRNALAHTLDRERRSRKTTEFLAQYRSIEPNPSTLSAYDSAEASDKLLFAVAACLGFLASVSDEIDDNRTPTPRA